MPEATAKPLYLCYPFVKAALVTGKFKTIVQHPKYTDINEWVAMNCQRFHRYDVRYIVLMILCHLSVRLLQ